MTCQSKGSVDYRCDDENEKKKTVQLGRDTNHRAADNRTISKMPAINSQNTIVHPQTQKKKKKIMLPLSVSHPNFCEFALLVDEPDHQTWIV